MSTRQIHVTSEVPAHLVWSAAEHSQNKNVTIVLLFFQDDGAEWRFTNRDISGVVRQPMNKQMLMIHFFDGKSLLYYPYEKEGVLHTS